MKTRPLVERLSVSSTSWSPWKQLHAPTDPPVGELDDGVAVDRDLTRLEVADPVVRQVRPDDADVPRAEGPMWSPAMKLPCVLVMRWISYSDGRSSRRSRSGKSWVIARNECCGWMGMTSRRGSLPAYGPTCLPRATRRGRRARGRAAWTHLSRTHSPSAPPPPHHPRPCGERRTASWRGLDRAARSRNNSTERGKTACLSPSRGPTLQRFHAANLDTPASAQPHFPSTPPSAPESRGTPYQRS